MAEVKLSVSGQAELKALAARLKAAGDKGLRSELRKAIKKATGPAVRDVQQAARTMKVTGARGGGKKARRLHYTGKRAAKGGHGLRATIARATRAEIKPGGDARVTIRTYARYLPMDQRKLPRYLDRPKGWRHPVFGDRADWVTQYGEPWFASTLIRHGPAVRREILAAMKTVAEKIAKE